MSDPNDDPDALKTKAPGKAGKATDPLDADDFALPSDDFADFASAGSDDVLGFGGDDDLPPLGDEPSLGSLDDFGSLDDLAMPSAEGASAEGLDPFADEPLSPGLELSDAPPTPGEPDQGDAFAGFSMSDEAEPEAEILAEEPATPVLADPVRADLEPAELPEPASAALDEGDDAFSFGEVDLGADLVLDEGADDFAAQVVPPEPDAAWPEDEEESTFASAKMPHAEETQEEARHRVRKFMFDTSFDPVVAPIELPELENEAETAVFVPEEPDPEPEPPPPPPPPTFSEAELAAAREASRAEGEAAGIAATQASINAQFADAAKAIGGVLPGLMNDREQAVQGLSEEAARLAVALVAKALPELNRRYGFGEIEAVVKSSIALAVDQPRIIIRVASDLASGLSREFETLAQATGYQGRIIVLGDATMGPADVRIDWGDGGAERLAQKVWSELAAIVERVVGHLEQTAPVAERPAADNIGSAA
jgi:flagellar assembly protein FliH